MDGPPGFTSCACCAQWRGSDSIFVCALDAEIDGGFRRANPFRGLLFERGMRLADGRFAITENQVGLFREKGMPCALTRLLLQDREFAAPRQKSIDLLWVARCHPVKRPHIFLDLAERLPKARCRMICSKQDEPLWQSVRKRSATIPNLDFLEAVPYREIQRHFNDANIFVNTSEHEGVPNTFIHSGLGHAAILSLAVDPDGMFREFRAGSARAVTSKSLRARRPECSRIGSNSSPRKMKARASCASGTTMRKTSRRSSQACPRDDPGSTCHRSS